MTYIVKPVEEKRKLGIQPLQELVRATCLRRTKQQTLASGSLSLPRRTEKTCPVNLHPDDQILYDSVKKVLQKTASGSDKSLRKDVSTRVKEKNVMVLLNSLRLICNHGELAPQFVKSITGGSSASYIDHMQRHIDTAACSSCGGETDGSSVFTGAQGTLCVDCAHLERVSPVPQSEMNLEQKDDNWNSQSASVGKSTFGKAVKPSAKVVALVNNLRQQALISDQTQQPRKRYIPVFCRLNKTNRFPNLIQRCIQLLGQDA